MRLKLPLVVGTGEASVLRVLCHLARQQQDQLKLLLVVAAQALALVRAFQVHEWSALT